MQLLAVAFLSLAANMEETEVPLPLDLQMWDETKQGDGRDLKKRKRDDPVATGTLHIWDLGFLDDRSRKDAEEEDVKDLDKKFLEWRKYLVEKMEGIELNLEGVKFRLSVSVPASDDFEGYSRGRREPDTFTLRGLPSRWFYS
ncbi:hypothetical protein K1719_009906 [Acacia pycnantha]|nr:hypothetical protein K1719_009906 [Acacia pycnantha]